MTLYRMQKVAPSAHFTKPLAQSVKIFITEAEHLIKLLLHPNPLFVIFLYF